ncbi:PEP-CTERM sorting domain-containing protein [Poriferisphaera sp. WC338]|uniref:PEP-CTERM sorting domain-containing protein n=1 Tax=Poriferisphaera sp. WC338 TaxID=3425129 RepID=UPI003D818ABC
MIREILTCSVLLVSGLVISTPTDATVYRATFGIIEDVGDLNASDSLNYNAITGGEIIFTIPDTLVLESNIQNQGGSSTRYSGTIFNQVTFTTTTGNSAFVLNSNAELHLWDRAPGQVGGWNYINFETDDSSDGVVLELRTNSTHPNHGNIFNLGTPNPNTLFNSGLVTFANETERDNIYHTPYFQFFGSGASLPNGWIEMTLKSLEIIPEPSSIALIGLGSLMLIRRRKSN